MTEMPNENDFSDDLRFMYVGGEWVELSHDEQSEAFEIAKLRFAKSPQENQTDSGSQTSSDLASITHIQSKTIASVVSIILILVLSFFIIQSKNHDVRYQVISDCENISIVYSDAQGNIQSILHDGSTGVWSKSFSVNSDTIPGLTINVLSLCDYSASLEVSIVVDDKVVKNRGCIDCVINLSETL
jgi:hypothetical protein